MNAHMLYFHGFASSVKTAKGVALGQRLAGSALSYRIPDLEGGDFRSMTMDGILRRAQAAVQELPQDGRPLLIIGSSLGGYLAALLAAQGGIRRRAALLLIAPAFGFPSAWRTMLGEEGIERWRATGERLFFHHASERELPLGYGFLDSCQALPDLPGEPRMATAIVHGHQDQTVDALRSLDYARQRALVELHLVEGDHRLTEPRHEDLMVWCARDLVARLS